MTTTATPPKLELPKKQPMQYRSCELSEITPLVIRAADDTETTDNEAFKIVISTDTPIERMAGYVEVLGHKPSEVDLSYAKRGLPFLLEHGGPDRTDRPDPAYRLGEVTDIKLRDGQLVGIARFAVDEALSEQGLRIKRDWQSGKPTWRYLSVGMVQMTRKVTEALRAGEQTVVRWVRWQPRETSNVAAPMDFNAAKERSADLEAFEVTDEPAETQQRSQEATVMTQTTTTPDPGATAAPATAAAAIAVGEDALKTRNAEVAQIVSLCVAQKCAERSAEFINAGLSFADVKVKLFDELATRNAQTQSRTPGAEVLDGMGRNERKRFSYRRAALMGLRAAGGLKREGLEYEVHKALVQNLPPQWESRGGILVPFDLRSEDEIAEAFERKLELRSMDTKTAGKGAEWVGEQQMPLVEFLEAATVLTRLGANFNTGLTGSLAYPRETGQPSVVFQGENPPAPQTLTDAATGEITSGPKQMIGGTKLSRMFLLQTRGAGEARVRNALVNGTARAIDRAGFHGTGAGSQPTGLYSALISGVQTQSHANVAPTITTIAAMGGKISDQNADLGRMGWATTALLAWFLRAKLEFSASGSQPIWTGPIAEGMIAGYRAIGTTQLLRTLGAGSDEHGFVFGNWSYCDVNLWGATELVVDELTAGDSAMVIIRSYGMGDVVFTHPEAFCIGTAAKAA